jgi:5-dehydro-2-deoxygluconokinase
MTHADSIARPDRDASIELLHRTSTRRPAPARLFVLAFDHRRQLEAMIQSVEPVARRISAFKSLVCDAVERVAGTAGGEYTPGIIVDDRYGGSVLARMTAKQWWIGRPVEIPGSRPLEFDTRNGIGLPISKWPASHVVKSLVFYHPQDPLELRLQQEERVRQLHADCVDLDRELLLEVIVTASGKDCDDSTVANAMRRFYNLGISPAWWKLESQSTAGWQEISDVIECNDPLCHGVLLLGLNAPETELRASFRRAAPFPVCKGFAVGRSIFVESARRWLAGEISDEVAVEAIADKYRRMIRFWQAAAEPGRASKPRRATIEVGAAKPGAARDHGI